MISLYLKNIKNRRVRSVNSKLVLDYIRINGSSERKELADALGLTNASISNICSELLDTGFIIEIGAGESAGGRKPQILKINGNAAFILGLDVRENSVLYVLSNLNGDIICKNEIKVSGEDQIDDILSVLMLCFDDTEAILSETLGVGITFSGSGEFDKEEIVKCIKEKLGIEVLIEDQAVCEVLAEYWFDDIKKRKSRYFSIVVNQQSINNALLIDGQVFRLPEKDYFGIGHLIVSADGTRCRCGKYGCLEAMVNADAIVSRIREAAKLGYRNANLKIFENPDEIALDDVYDTATKNDVLSLGTLLSCSKWLSMAILNSISLIAPDVIVFCGTLFENYPDILENIKLSVESLIPKMSNKLIHPTFNKYQAAYGAVSVVLDNFFEHIDD